MRVGFLGLGKLGLPVATAMAARGIEVYGHDPKVDRFPVNRRHEQGWDEAIIEARDGPGFVLFGSVQQVVEATEGVIFVAVPTPHASQFEGVTPLTDERADFDYSFLIRAIEDITEEAGRAPLTIAVISTVLPGTLRRYILPGLPSNISLVYSPSFIAMGTTIPDFLNPEFVLLGGDEDFQVQRVYETIFGKLALLPIDGAPDSEYPTLYSTSIENAELIKVAYNTFIGLKIAFANTLMEVSHKTGCDVDEVTDALSLATRRLISPAYMRGGMGDGGACHPRDNFALSWLARELHLSYDIFGQAMKARERQANWLVSLMDEYDLPKGILGISYKAGSHLTTGSAALLCADLLDEDEGVYIYDPHAMIRAELPAEPRVWLVGCNHPEFPLLKFPEGSVVIDPWRYMPDQGGVTVVRIGAASHDGQMRDGEAGGLLAASDVR